MRPFGSSRTSSGRVRGGAGARGRGVHIQLHPVLPEAQQPVLLLAIEHEHEQRWSTALDGDRGLSIHCGESQDQVRGA